MSRTMSRCRRRSDNVNDPLFPGTAADSVLRQRYKLALDMRLGHNITALTAAPS